MSDIYERDSLIWAYAKWHYSQGLREFFGVAGNFLGFVSNFFSFKLLLKTWFAPWKRLGENYDGGFNISSFASTVLVNTLMRVVGFLTRTAVLIVGFVVYILLLVFIFFVAVIWLLAPAILVGSVVLAVTFFII